MHHRKETSPLYLSRLPAIFAILCSIIGMSNGVASDTTATPSAYTSVKSGDCSAVPKQVAELYESQDLTAEKCQAPAGWILYIVSSDERSWLDLGRGDAIWTTEQQVVYQNEFGDFPNVGAERVEWRMSGKSAQALIFRVSAQSASPKPTGGGAKLSRLFVVRLEADSPLFCGVAKTNDAARALASDSSACNKPLARRLPK